MSVFIQDSSLSGLFAERASPLLFCTVSPDDPVRYYILDGGREFVRWGKGGAQVYKSGRWDFDQNAIYRCMDPGRMLEQVDEEEFYKRAGTVQKATPSP